MLGRRDSVQSIIRAFPYLGRGCIVIVAAVAIITSGLSVSTTSSAYSVVSPADVMDRTTKGDRLPLVSTPPLKGTKRTGSNRHLPVGCEAVASPLTHSSSAHVARRCLS
jgi:hypothetical protein